MATYLAGGLLFLGMLASLVRPAEAAKCIAESPGGKELVSLFSVVAVAVMSVPIGYLMNQMWMAFYNVFLDVHLTIFPVDATALKADLGRSASKHWWKRHYRQAYLNELYLALLHRSEAGKFSEQFLSWHRNRLNALHSNGTSIFSIYAGLICCVIISNITHLTEWVVHPVSLFLRERIWLIALIGAMTVLSILRMVRERKMIILYNQIALTHQVSLSVNGIIQLDEHKGTSVANESSAEHQSEEQE